MDAYSGEKQPDVSEEYKNLSDFQLIEGGAGEEDLIMKKTYAKLLKENGINTVSDLNEKLNPQKNDAKEPKDKDKEKEKDTEKKEKITSIEKCINYFLIGFGIIAGVLYKKYQS